METKFIESDPYSPIGYVYSMSTKLFSVNSLQKIDVWQSPFFGKVLTCDGVVQVTERDEFIYHEMLAHVALHSHVHPTSVLIVGGGDGGTLREVLKHECVSKVVLVEIDPEVINVAKQFFPSLSCGFSDERAQIIIADGADYILQCKEKFDVILVDSTDPVGPAISLYDEEFFQNANNILTERGLFVIQSESIHFHLNIVQEIQRKLAKRFPIRDLYTAPIATYAGNWWTFSIASKAPVSRRPCNNVINECRYYAEDVHISAYLPFSLFGKLKILEPTFNRL